MELFGKRMVERNFANGIDTRLYHKDLGIVLELARAAGIASPGGAAVMQQINALMGQGRGHDDLAALMVESCNEANSAHSSQKAVAVEDQTYRTMPPPSACSLQT